MTSEKASIGTTCPSCGALPSYPCRKRSGLALRKAHPRRLLAHLTRVTTPGGQS